MTIVSLLQHSMLGPYADVVALLIGPMPRECVRTDPSGRPMLVTEALASWSTTGSLAGFATAHRRLPLLVSEARKEHVLPIELARFPPRNLPGGGRGYCEKNDCFRGLWPHGDARTLQRTLEKYPSPRAPRWPAGLSFS